VQTVEIAIPYTPREEFLALHNRSERWAAVVAHRRAGKTVACINELIKGALTCHLPNPRFAYVAPTFGQAKDVVWEYLKEFAGVIPGVTFHETELRADFPNGARVRLYSSDKYDRMRGVYFDGIVLDEYADMDPRAWTEVIRPALSDRKGWGVFIGTPKGRNGFWQIYDQATKQDNWLALVLKASETGLVDQAELEDAKRSMSADQYAQEYECSFQAAVVGAYYAQQMNRLEDDKRLGRVPWDSAAEVITAWDLGVGDSTAIWFMQAVGQERRIIDYYEGSGVGLDHYVKVVREKPYTYEQHILPHDVEVKEMSTGKSRKEFLEGLGLEVTVAPKLSIEDGINSVRNMLEACWFDAEKCERGIEALRHYRAEYDDKREVLRLRPVHDWSSHGADAFRYLAVGYKSNKADWSGWSQPNVKWVV